MMSWRSCSIMFSHRERAPPSYSCCGINHPPYSGSSHHRWVSLLTLVPKAVCQSVWQGWGDVLLWTRGERDTERERERERERAPLPLSLPPLLCAALRPGRSFLPPFLISSSQLALPPLGCWLAFSSPARRRRRAGPKYFAGWNDWLPVLHGLNFGGWGGRFARRKGGESRGKKGGSPSPEGIYFTVSRRNVIPVSSFRSSHTSHLCECLKNGWLWQAAGNMAGCCVFVSGVCARCFSSAVVCVSLLRGVVWRCVRFHLFIYLFVLWCAKGAVVHGLKMETPPPAIHSPSIHPPIQPRPGCVGVGAGRRGAWLMRKRCYLQTERNLRDIRSMRASDSSSSWAAAASLCLRVQGDAGTGSISVSPKPSPGMWTGWRAPCCLCAPAPACLPE